MPKIMVFASCIVTCIIVLNCNDKSNSNPTSPSALVERTEDYSVSGNNLFLYIPAGANNYCDSITLIISPADTTVERFEISGTTLTTFDSPDSSGGYSDSTVIIQTYTVFNRVNGGPGLTGTWSLTRNSYNILRGTLTASEKSSLDSESTFPGDAQIEFSDGIVHIRANVSYADVFMQTWKSIGAPFAITVLELSAAKVQMTGTMSGEVVTLTYDNSGNGTFSSSVPGHIPGTVYDRPASCPNSAPAWFESFLQANYTSSVTLSKGRIKRILPGGMRKPCNLSFLIFRVRQSALGVRP